VNPGVRFKCTADIFSSIANREIVQPGMVIARKMCQVSLVGCTYDWYNSCSCRKLVLRIPPPIAGVHLAVNLNTLGDSQAHWFKINVDLEWVMCQKELHTFENIAVV